MGSPAVAERETSLPERGRGDRIKTDGEVEWALISLADAEREAALPNWGNEEHLEMAKEVDWALRPLDQIEKEVLQLKRLWEEEREHRETDA